MKRRLSNVTVACPIVYGNFSQSLGKKADETATHRWTLFIRGPSDEDLSTFVSKIAFSLHPSFAHPIREIFSAPFEISENGWGEFEAGIRIFFRDPDEQPLDITHTIKLYHGDKSQQGHNPKSTVQPVMSEFYDEIIFTDPTPEFRRQLMMYTPPVVRKINEMTEYYTIFSDDEDIRLLTLAQDYLNNENEAAKCKLLRLDAELGHLAVTMPPPAGGNSVSSSAVAHQSTSNQSAQIPASGTAVVSSSSATTNRKKGGSKSTVAEVAPAPSKTTIKAPAPSSSNSKVPPRPQQALAASSSAKGGGQQLSKSVNESPPTKTPVFSHPSQVQAFPSTVFKLNPSNDSSRSAPAVSSSSPGNVSNRPA